MSSLLLFGNLFLFQSYTKRWEFYIFPKLIVLVLEISLLYDRFVKLSENYFVLEKIVVINEFIILV